MFLTNTTSQKIISFFLIIAVLSPAFIIFSIPRQSSAIFGVADVVFDPALFLKEVWKVIKETIRQFLMAIARKLLDKITQSTVNWINSGFRGKPLFLENPGSFLKDVAKEQIKSFVNVVGYDSLKFPFGKNYALGVIGQAKTQFEQNAQYSLSKYYSSSAELEYRKNNFEAGGWNDFILNTQFPQNNFIGFSILADEELAVRTVGENSAVQRVKDTVSQGMGFLSPQVCKSNPDWSPEKLSEGYQKPLFIPPRGYVGDPNYQAQYDAAKKAWEESVQKGQADFNKQYACPEGPAATTPGSQVANSIMTALGSKQRQGELGAALGNSLAALFDALINKFFNAGLTALSGAINPTPNPSVSDFDYFGNTTGSEGPQVGNPPTNPESRIRIDLNLINDDGGLAGFNDIDIYIDGNPAPVGSPVIYEAGNHTVSSSYPSGYTSSIGGDCSSNGNLTLGIGELKVCSVVIDDIGSGGGTALLTVHKVVVNDNGGTLQEDDVPLFVDGNLKINHVQYSYITGTYTVSETNPPGYTASIIGDCAPDGTIVLQAGDVKNCTIINNDI